MVKADIKIEKKNAFPNFLYLVKLAIFAVVTHFLVLPLIFQTFTFFGELRSFWQTILSVVISVYLSDLIQIKVAGRDYF